MTTKREIPTIASIRELVADGLSEDLLSALPGVTTARIHATTGERVPLFNLASFCRFLDQPLREHGDDKARLAAANARFVPAVDALLEGLDQGLPSGEMYQRLDAAIAATAAANRALNFGEGAGGHP